MSDFSAGMGKCNSCGTRFALDDGMQCDCPDADWSSYQLEVWCPDCFYFNEECYVDPEDYSMPCEAFTRT